MPNQSKTPSIIGGACVVASVCVGAGMLGLPTAGAGAWTYWSLGLIGLTMVVITLSGWMLLEAFKAYPLQVSFHTVTRSLLGRKINFINNLSVYFVGAILLYAYTTSAGQILNGLLDVNAKLAATLFVLLFSSFVWISTRAVDRVSVLLIVFMLLSFFFGISGLAQHIQFEQVFNFTQINDNAHASYAPYAIALLPVALTSFGYHHSVASMRIYYQGEEKAKWAILGGTSIALFFYVVWIMSVFGNLPRANFAPVIAAGGDVEVLLNAIGSVAQTEQTARWIRAFSMAAILSSFIGVGLGVFDYLADRLGFDNSKSGRLKTWAATFLPPLVCSLLFPFGFVLVIGLAGAAATIWTCIVPALLVYKIRQRPEGQQGFKAPGGQLALWIVLSFGVITAIVHVLTLLNLLPQYTG